MRMRMRMRMRMQIESMLAGVVAVVAAQSAFAEEPLYFYGDVEYVVMDPDVGSSLDGFRLSGSHPVGDDFHVTGQYSRVNRTGLRFTEFGAAFGYHTRIAYRTDLVGRVGIVRARAAPAGVPSTSQNALLLEFGLRGMVNWNLELNGFISHRDLDDSETRLDVGAAYYVTEQIGITGGVSFGSDDTTLSIGARFTIPGR
jgi:hypothetical protein